MRVIRKVTNASKQFYEKLKFVDVLLTRRLLPDALLIILITNFEFV
jgi:hypothetical protein